MGRWGYMWKAIEPFISTLLNEESPTLLKDIAILTSPHLEWAKFTDSKHLIHLFGAATSVITYTDEIGRSVVDTLLQIASDHNLQPHVPSGMWLWLNKSPLLPPLSQGRSLGSGQGVVKMIRALGDIQILKSYLVHVWSEWDSIDFDLPQDPDHEMCTSIREDFGGIGMRCHRKDLLQRLNHILGQLDLGLYHLRKERPNLIQSDIQRMKGQYEELKKVLVEVDGAVDILIREPPISGTPFSLLTLDRSRISLSSYVHNSSPMFVIVCLGCPLLLSTLHPYLPMTLYLC